MSSNLGSYVTSFTMYKFIKDITTPFTQFEAYRLGIIDAKGDKRKEPLTEREKQAYSTYYQMIFNVKKIFAKVPDPKTKAQLQSVVAAIQLFGEDVEKMGGDKKSLIEGIDSYFKENGIDLEEYKIDLAFEEMGGAPTNSMGAGGFGVASPGISSRSPAIAGFDPLLFRGMRRRKKKDVRNPFNH
jgi:hypothetical protein